MNANDDFQSYGAQMERRRIEAAEALKAEAERERDAMKKELEDIRNALAWTMGKLKSADLILHASEEEASEARHHGELEPDAEDSARMSWINQNGRVGLGNGSVTIALPYFGNCDEEIPVPYNIRHLIDICRLPENEGDES
jgi:hypothetical protein